MKIIITELPYENNCAIQMEIIVKFRLGISIISYGVFIKGGSSNLQ